MFLFHPLIKLNKCFFLLEASQRSSRVCQVSIVFVLLLEWHYSHVNTLECISCLT